MAAKPKAQLWARRGLDGQARAESGVGLGQEGPQLSHALGLILPKAPDSDQTDGALPRCKAEFPAGGGDAGAGPCPLCLSQSPTLRLSRLLPPGFVKTFPRFYHLPKILLSSY